MTEIEPKATRGFGVRGLLREPARSELFDARLEVKSQLVVHLRLDGLTATQSEMEERPDAGPYLAGHGRACYAVRGSRIDTTVRA